MPHLITYLPQHQSLFPHPKHAPCQQPGSGKNLPADGNVNMPRDLYLHGATILPLIQHIYPTIQSNPHPAPAYFINCMLLAPSNEDVHVINHKIIDMFHASPTETRVYQSADSAIIWDS